jgi:phosphoglycerate dehydrogenase-like enzyme
MTSQLRVHIENSSSIGPLFTITPDMVSRAKARHPAVRGRWTATYGADLDGFESRVESADALLGWQFPHRDLDKLAPRLSWIQLTGAGVDHLLPLDWLSPHVTLTNARGAHRPKIGEALFMAILMINNFIPALAHQQRQHRWNQLFSTGIAGKTLLVVGLGEAGGSAATLAKRFGMTVLATARRATDDPEVDEVHAPDRLHALLPRADIVLVTLPLTPDTRGLVGATEIGLMKKGAGLVNLSRHGVVDDDALMAALRSEQLSGCVYDLEDPAHRPFDARMWACPNLVLLPHSQTNDPETFMDNVLDIFFENLERRLDDRPLANVVDPVLGY